MNLTGRAVLQPSKQIGRRFGRLLVVSKLAGKGQFFECLCDCGNVKIIRASTFLSGHARSCGCLQKEIHRATPMTHGMAGTRTYRIWQGMIRRCTNPKDVSYKYYGARGVCVCDRWREFSCFFSDMGECPPGYTIDRIESSGHYEPGNCRWLVRSKQNSNKRASVKFTINGRTQILTEWAREYRIHPLTLRRRFINLRWPLAAALTLALNK